MRKKKELFLHKVETCEQIVDNVFTVKITKQFDFVPGQVVAVALSQEEEPRLYSLCGAKDDEFMAIFFDVYDTGFLTPRLKNVKKGDDIWVSEPFGKFISSDKEEWWIATGTGIAPFLSMIKSGIKRPLKFLHGSRTIAHFFYQDFFEKELGEDYMRFCTKESAENVISGRLTHWLSAQNSLPKDIKYYLCGNPDMVVEVRDILIEKGVAFEDVVAEIYF